MNWFSFDLGNAFVCMSVRTSDSKTTAPVDTRSIMLVAWSSCKMILIWTKEFILEWTTSLDTSSRTLFVREGGREGGREEGCLSTSRRTSSYVITSDCY